MYGLGERDGQEKRQARKSCTPAFWVLLVKIEAIPIGFGSELLSKTLSGKGDTMLHNVNVLDDNLDDITGLEEVGGVLYKAV